MPIQGVLFPIFKGYATVPKLIFHGYYSITSSGSQGMSEFKNEPVFFFFWHKSPTDVVSQRSRYNTKCRIVERTEAHW